MPWIRVRKAFGTSNNAETVPTSPLPQNDDAVSGGIQPHSGSQETSPATSSRPQYASSVARVAS